MVRYEERLQIAESDSTERYWTVRAIEDALRDRVRLQEREVEIFVGKVGQLRGYKGSWLDGKGGGGDQ